MRDLTNLINRQNWLDVKAFLKHQANVRQNDQQTVSRYRTIMRHVLEWAGSRSLTKARSFPQTLPAYLLTVGRDVDGKPFSPATLGKMLQVTRLYFLWSKSEWSHRYKEISISWVETLQPPRRAGVHSRLKEHEHYRLEDIIKIADLKVETLRERRDQAALCFLFLSGMRVSAFSSLPISCVDLEELKVYQLPERGVMTKNSKAAITFLLPIPELLNVVKRWDSLIRKQLSPEAYWYANMTHEGPRIEIALHKKWGRHRRETVAEGIMHLCKLANIPYMSPHKLRHGHIVYALRNVKDMAGLKAVSQNVMHSSVTITDSIYGNMAGEDVKKVISGIGENGKPTQTQNGDLEAAAKLLELLRDNPNLINNLIGKK